MPPMSVPRPSVRRPRARSLLVDLALGHLAQRQEHAGRLDHHHDHHQRHGEDQHRVEHAACRSGRAAPRRTSRPCRPSRSSSCRTSGATTPPMTMPSSTEMLAMKPLANLTISRIDTSTIAAMPTPVRSAYLGLGTLGHDRKALRDHGRQRAGCAGGRRHLRQPLGVLGLTMRRRGRPDRVAEDPVDAHAHQADADDHDDRAGDHRRKEAQHAADQRRDQDRDDARADDGAEDQARALRRRDCRWPWPPWARPRRRSRPSSPAA